MQKIDSVVMKNKDIENELFVDFWAKCIKTY